MSEQGPSSPSGPSGPQRPNLRVLHPGHADRLSGAEPPSPTLYFGDRLLVAGFPDSVRDLRMTALAEALAPLGLTYRMTDKSQQRIERQRASRGVARDLLDEIWVSSVVLELTSGAGAPPDAWSVLQQLRATATPEVVGTVSLEHVVRPAGGYWDGIGGYWDGIGGYWDGIGGYWDGIGGYWDGISQVLAEYSRPGRGGRMPVSLTIEDPARRARELPRHPVVAILDTAVAKHPWFDLAPAPTARGRRGRRRGTSGPGIERLVVRAGELVADTDPNPGIAPSHALTGVRERLEGHGTFVAGLVRQGCPEARILSVPVMGGDGMAEESDVIEALSLLLTRHLEGQQGGAALAHQVVDVLSLSLGYYAEDASYLSGPVKLVLDRFAQHGVLVVAGVGNDATEHPFVPAALAAPLPATVSARSVPPVASVGAQNPDGVSVALFSNAPPVVTALRRGVSLVSTVPPVDGTGQSSVATTGPGGAGITGTTPGRRTMDPDDYSGGFAVWSGTSFSTPVLAAELAAALVAQGDLTDVGDPVMRRRALRALRQCTTGSPS